MDINLIRDKIEKNAASVTGSFGVYFRDFVTGAEIKHNADEVFPSASVYKIFVLAELFRKFNDGECTPQDRFPLRKNDKMPGSGVLQFVDDGAELTLRDYATLMMIISDNTAAIFLLRFTGENNIRKNVLEPLKLNATKCNISCHENETSPANAAKILELLYYGLWHSKEWDDKALGIMKQCQTNSRIPKYLPAGTVVAHKTGTINRVTNDVGIIYTPKGDYILSMFYNGKTASKEEYNNNADNNIGERLLAKLSKELYEAYVS